MVVIRCFVESTTRKTIHLTTATVVGQGGNQDRDGAERDKIARWRRRLFNNSHGNPQY